MRSAVMAAAALVGMGFGALAGYGCSQGTLQRDPMPIATAHRTPREAPPVEPPETIRQPEAAPDPYEDRPAIPSAEPDVRVRVAALRSPTSAPRFTHPAGTLIITSAQGTSRTIRTPVEVRATDKGFTVTEAAGTSAARPMQMSGRRPLEFRPPVGARATITFAGVDWPGSMRVVPLAESPSAVDLVVDVPLERYLPGVLARELYKSWSPETFRAQAIAARSFAICEHAHWSETRHFDLIAGEASQAWIGEVKDARPRAAVADTQGMVLVYEDRVVPAFYSSTCGGTPANAVDSLTRNPHYGIAPLLAGADDANAHRDCCRAAPRYRWEQKMPVSYVLSQLRRWSKDQLADERTAAARAASKVATTSTSSAADSTTTAATGDSDLGSGALLMRTDVTPPTTELAQQVSTGVLPAIDDVATDAPLSNLSTVQGLRSVTVLANNPAGRPVRVRLVDAHGTTLDMRAEDFRRAVNYAPEGQPTPKDRLNSSSFKAEVAGANILFKGSGFGHGVGMCQFGAEAMAQKGSSAQQILRIYYPGATLRKAY